MDKNNFYADETPLTSGIVCTKWIPDIFTDGNLKTNIAEPYIMGYIPYDESPQSLFDLHTIAMGNNLTAINFGTLKENRAWGYCWQDATGSSTRFAGQAYGIDTDNSLYMQNSSSNAKIRFTNSIQYSQLFMVDNIDFQVETFCFPTANIDENENAHNGNNGHMTKDYAIRRQDMHDFLKGTYTISGVSYKHPGDSTTYTTTLSYSDFDLERGIAKKVVDSDYTLYIIFNEVGGSLSGARYSYYNGSIWTDGAVNITPFILCSVDDSVGFNAQKILYTPLGYSSVGGQPRFTLQNSKETFAPSPAYSKNYHCIKHACTSWYGSLDTVNLSDFSKTSGIHYEMIRGRCFLYFSGGDGNTFEFIPIVKPLDIYRAYLLLNSINTGVTTQASLTNPNPPSYSSTQTVALFKEDNTPKYEYEQGDTAQAATPAILQPWQMPNAYNYDNTFKQEDIPPYNPAPGEDDDPHGGPGWLANNAFPYGALNGFVTLYCLTPRQLGAFGQYLWAGFFDTDFIDSLVVTAFEAASLNTSDILNFIPSVKYYPISLNGLDNWHSGVDSTIFIGRGVKGVDLNTAAHVGDLTSYCAGVTCESVNIEPVFGDFRDFEPCTRLTLFVPFCGTMELTPSQVMGKGQPGKVYLKYLIDFSTGACECAVEIENGGWRSIVGTLSGTIGANVELTASNLSQVIQSFGKAVVGVTTTVAMATIGAGGASAAAEVGGKAAQAEAALQGTERSMLANTAGNINSLLSLNTVPQPVMGESGGYSAFINLAPMIQRTYHHYAVPENFAHAYGYACNKTVTLSELEGKGFTVCRNVDLHGIPATQDELTAIESLLTSGVYF